MMRKLFLLSSLLVFMTSCYKYNKPSKPDYLISKKDMVNILVDIRLIKSVTGVERKKLDSLNVEVNTYVYNKYNIDSVAFAQSNQYYSYHLEDYEEIYAKVDDSLLKLKTQIKSLLEAEKKAKKEKDSISKLKIKKIEKDEIIEEEISTEIEKELEEIEFIEPVSDND